jgi:hypothetical protein
MPERCIDASLAIKWVVKGEAWRGCFAAVVTLSASSRGGSGLLATDSENGLNG